jgi:hypothetical protein
VGCVLFDLVLSPKVSLKPVVGILERNSADDSTITLGLVAGPQLLGWSGNELSEIVHEDVGATLAENVSGHDARRRHSALW